MINLTTHPYGIYYIILYIKCYRNKSPTDNKTKFLNGNESLDEKPW